MDVFRSKTKGINKIPARCTGGFECMFLVKTQGDAFKESGAKRWRIFEASLGCNTKEPVYHRVHGILAHSTLTFQGIIKNVEDVQKIRI